MMKYKKTLIVLLICAVACSVVGAIFVSASSPSWSEVSFDEYYAYGEMMEIPSCKLTVGQNTANANISVTFPDGRVYDSSAIKLNNVGNYTVRYYAKVGDKQYAKEYSFSVKAFGYNVEKEGSSLTYGKYTAFGANSTGLIARLANGDKLTFLQTIDVSKLSKSNPIAELFITPDYQGVADFNKLTITLTDVKHSDIYLTLDVNRSQFSGNGLGYVWVMAGGNGQDMVGYESSAPGKNPHVNDDIGTPVTGASFTAQDNSGVWNGPAHNIRPDSKTVKLYYDYATNSVYAGSQRVSALDNSDFYKDLWFGFPSGKARLTITASGYLGETANFCIKSIAGLSAEALKNNTFSDTIAPEITIDTDYETMPFAQVGLGYPVPDAEGFDDFFGICDVDVAVYYGNIDESPLSVGITGGRFVPDKIGDYSIVYTSKDGFDNTSNKVLHVQAIGKTDDVIIELPIEEREVELGTFVEFEDVEVSGGSGKVNVETSVDFKGERLEAAGGFRPEVLGDYIVTYKATDYIGKEAIASYKVKTKAGSKPVFVDQMNLPPVYISGGRYVLPKLYANDYSSGSLSRIQCDVKVTDSNGEKSYKSGDEFVPTVKNNGDKIKVVYLAKGTIYNEFNVPVIIAKDKKKVLMSNYLYGEDVTVSVRDDEGKNYATGIAVSPKDGKTRAEWTYANALLVNEAGLVIQTISGKTNYKQFEFRFTDSIDGTCSATVVMRMSDQKIELVNGENTISLTARVKAGGTIKVVYRSGRVYVTCNENVDGSIPLTVYDNGEKFEDFPSSKLYLSVATAEDKGNSRYMVMSVCENSLSYRNADRTAPSLVVIGEYAGKYQLNDMYTISSVKCGDVFAPQAAATLSVTMPDDSIAKDANGKELTDVQVDREYQLRLSMYGKYKFTYTIEEVDWVGNTPRTFYYEVSVVDEEAPTIRFDDNGTKTAKVGDVIVMPTFTVTDNLTPTDEIIVSAYVISAEGKMVALKDGSNAIKCNYSGKYTFVVCAIDGEGNSSSEQYVVYVK